MNFFSDTQETASRFGDYIDDLHDVFRCNGIDFGSPEDFFAFARTVKYHSELRGDVLRVVKSVMESETDISFRTILTIIAVASGGPEVATSDREMSMPVKLVIESLIGVGARRQHDSEQPDGLYSDLTVKETARTPALDNSSSSDGEASGHKEAEETFRIPVLDTSLPDGEEARGHTEVEKAFVERAASDPSGDSSIGPSSDSSIEGGPANGYSDPANDSQYPSNDYGSSNTVAESLTRLELNSLQLRIYLDSIDQRISRMEPRLENVAPFVLSAAPAHPREESEARYSATISPDSSETEPPSETEPEPPHNDPPVSNQSVSNEQSGAATGGRVTTGAPAVLTHLWTDSPKFYALRKPSALPILAGVATLLLAASLFWGIGRDTGYVVVHPVDGESHVAPAGNSVTPVKGAQRNRSSSTPNYPGKEVSHPADKLTQESKRSAQVPFSSPSPSSSSLAADAETPPVTATETSEIADSSDRPYSPSDRAYRLSSEPLSNRRIDVSSGMMAANLVSGPKPSYPALASLTRTQGNVVMQVVISKNGTVEDMHVIKGHRLLRSAAKNAVRTWRYRPYKINGVPVEVATVVSVDFSLHR
jgi:TonB family protein